MFFFLEYRCSVERAQQNVKFSIRKADKDMANLIVYYSRKGQNYWNGSIVDLSKGNSPTSV